MLGGKIGGSYSVRREIIEPYNVRRENCGSYSVRREIIEPYNVRRENWWVL